MAALNQTPPVLKNPFSSTTFSSSTTTSSTTYTSSSPQSTQNPTDPSTSPTDPSTAESEQRTYSPDGRRNSSGEILPSPTENWKPTFNRVQSWNREDRKREITLEREIGEHEGRGGGFSEK